MNSDAFGRTLGITLATSLLGLAVGCAAHTKPAETAVVPGIDDTSYAVVLGVDVITACDLARDTTYFPFDSAQLTPQAQENLDLLASCMKNGRLSQQRILLEGFADPRGDAEYNAKLGGERAQAVAQYLKDQGVQEARMDVTSRGETGVSYFDGRGFAYDRRVELSLSNRVGGFATWDRNANDTVDPGEFRENLGKAESFAMWDRNEDGEIDEREFAHGVFLGWDTNADGLVDRYEWYRGTVAWYPHNEGYGSWAAWDVDADEIVSRREMARGVGETALFAKWNADAEGGLNPEEYADGSYLLWDRDGDGQVDRVEFYESSDAGWYWYVPEPQGADGEVAAE